MTGKSKKPSKGATPQEDVSDLPLFAAANDEQNQAQETHVEYERICWPDPFGSSSPANDSFALSQLGYLFSYNTRTHEQMYSRAGKTGPVNDRNIAYMRRRIREEFGYTPRKETIRDAIEMSAYARPFDPVLKYLKGLSKPTKADLTAIKTWMIDYLGAEDTPLNREIGIITLVAGVRRVRKPGCPYDLVPVLIGVQGCGKSRCVRIMARKPAWHADQEILHLRAQEQQEALSGIWIYELGELGGMDKASNEKVKAFVSRTRDRARPAFRHYKEDRRRSCIFIATTNQEEFLTDPSGNRRFIPIKVGKVRLKALAKAMDGLWAAAAKLEKEGRTIDLPKSLWGEAASVQAAAMEHDPWADELSDMQGEKVNGVWRISYAEIAGRLGLGRSALTRGIAKRITAIMVQLGWTKLDKPYKRAGKTVRGFSRRAPPEAPAQTSVTR